MCESCLGRLATILLVGSAVPVTPPVAAQEVSGIVSDARSASPVSLATVFLLSDEFEVVSTTETSALGTFSFPLPDDGIYVLSINADGYLQVTTDTFHVRPSDDLETMVSLTPIRSSNTTVERTEPAGDAITVDIVGRILDTESREGLEGVAIEFTDLEMAVSSNSVGYFNVSDVPQGIHELRISRIGYETLTDTIFFEGGSAYQVDVDLSQDAVPLEGLTVQVRSRPLVRALANVQHRMDHNRHLGGSFVTRETFELRGNQPLSQILATMPGVQMVRRVAGGEFAVRFRGYCTGQPVLFIDGTKVAHGDELLELDLIPTIAIEIVEVYPGASSLPAEFGGSGSNCGAIAIWTRRGGD